MRRVWFYYEVNCMNIVMNTKKKQKKSFLDINLTLSSLKATGRNRKALCAGLTPVTPLWHVLFLRVTGSGAPRENLSPF